MKYIDEYRDGKIAAAIAHKIEAEASPKRSYNLMEFCGGHTHAIFRFGIEELLPENVRLIHGPGCPVCVLPVGRIDQAICCARIPGIVLCSYGDMLRVPGSNSMSLMKAKANGADVRVIYSTLDAVKLAQENPDREIVVLAIGFETTAPATAMAIRQAHHANLKNFSVLCNHVLTPSAIQSILESPQVRELGTIPIDGFIGPAHVSAILGTQPYHFFAEEYERPVVIAGFEPLDILQGILMLIRQLNEGRAEVENNYRRAVSFHGNEIAKKSVAEVFELRRSFEWRGLGIVPYSALRLKKLYGVFDAEERFTISVPPPRENKACACPAILRGLKKPTDCKLFGTICTPENPQGGCMVSSEGTCAAYYRHGRRLRSGSKDIERPRDE